MLSIVLENKTSSFLNEQMTLQECVLNSMKIDFHPLALMVIGNWVFLLFSKYFHGTQENF